MIEILKEKIEKSFSMNDDLWEDLQKKAKKKVVKKGEVLISYSSNQQIISCIVAGSFEMSLINANGDQKTIWFFFDDLFDVAVCMDSYFLKEPTKYEITALEDSVVFQITKSTNDLWRSKFPLFNQYYQDSIIGDYIISTEMRNYMVAHTPKEFIVYLKEHYPIFFERTPSKRIASFMGVTPEWYSKLRRTIDN
ncbi:MAG: hypothetical protein AAF348_16335 [Bacteroidota bacterium]